MIGHIDKFRVQTLKRAIGDGWENHIVFITVQKFRICINLVVIRPRMFAISQKRILRIKLDHGKIGLAMELYIKRDVVADDF